MKTNHILLTALLFCGAVACTKENIEIPDTVDDNTLYPVTFSGGIDLVQTKGEEVAASTMREGIKTKIFVYKSDESDFKTDTLASKEYTVGADGKLAIDPSDTIYLAKGSYKIRAFAIDTLPSISFPDFDFTNSGEFLALNDSSYLYAGADATIDGTAKAQNVNLTFKRKAVMIVINIESTNGITLEGWADTDSAKILPPDPGSTCKMKLSDGSIAAATSVYTNADDAKKMTCAAVTSGKTTVSYIMLPLVNNSSPVPTVTLHVKVKNATESTAKERKYETTLTYPTNGFESGKKYTYKATLKANGIIFNAAKVEDWTDGEFGEGNSGDLTPTEPADDSSGS